MTLQWVETYTCGFCGVAVVILVGGGSGEVTLPDLAAGGVGSAGGQSPICVCRKKVNRLNFRPEFSIDTY